MSGTLTLKPLNWVFHQGGLLGRVGSHIASIPGRSYGIEEFEGHGPKRFRCSLYRDNAPEFFLGEKDSLEEAQAFLYYKVHEPYARALLAALLEED